MAVVSAALLGVGLAGAASQMLGGLMAGDDAKKAAKKQARARYVQGQEEIRRTERSQKQQYGLVEAGTYASNIKMSGSAALYAKDFREEQQRQLDWQRKAIMMDISSIRAGGSAAANSAVIGGLAGGAGAAAGAVSNWWTSRPVA